MTDQEIYREYINKLLAEINDVKALKGIYTFVSKKHEQEVLKNGK